MIKTKLMASVATVAIAAMALTACSSGTSGSTASSTLTPAAQSALDAAYKGYGAELNLDPIKNIPTNVNYYVVSCGEQSPDCSSISSSMVSAAQAMGWKATKVDGKLNPQGFSDAIRQAIAGGANVISAIGIGCGVAQAAWKEAKAAGITIIGGGGVDDCSPKVWDSERLWLKDVTPKQQWENFGILAAEYLYGKTNGKAQALVLNFPTQAWGPWITAAFNDKLKALGGTTVAQLDVTDPEVADGSFVQKVITALQKNPSVNALQVPNDGWLLQGLAAALVQNDLASKITVVGRGGNAAVLDLIKAGNKGVTGTIGFATFVGAWGSVDTAARVLTKGTPAYIGEQMAAVDATHNMPASGAYQGSGDYQAAYKKAWGK